MSEENQHIDPALLDDANPAGLHPNAAVNGGLSLKETPRGIKKINKKGIVVFAGIIGAAAIVATTTFNGTGNAVSSAAQEAAAGQAKSRPSELKRDTLWYASVPDKLATGDDTATTAGAGAAAIPADAAAGAKTVPGGPVVPDLTGKAVTPFGAATAAKTGAAPYVPGPAGGAGAPAPGGAAGQPQSQVEQVAAQQEAQLKQKKQQDMEQAMKANLAAAGFGEKQAAQTQQVGLSGGAAGQAGGFMPAAMPLPAAGQREEDPNQQDRKDQFLKAQQRDIADTAYSTSRRTAARSLYELKAGGIIPAVLINGVNSDLPGQVIAQVSEEVRDTKTGRYVLIPQGTRLIGLYDAHVAYGQKRVLLAWNRMVFPDGSSFDLKGMPGADMGGFAGFFDEVDNHYVKIFGSSALLSLISAGVQLSQPSNGGGNNNQPSVSQTVSGALGQQIGQTGMTITQKSLNIQPTLEIRPGYKFNVMVTADLILTPSVK